MAQATKGNTVRIHYTGVLADGSQFDSSTGRDPLEFTLGDGMVIPGFDKAVDGMQIGESKTFDIPADEAYGERREEMVMSVPRGEFPDHIDPQAGQQLQMQQGEQTFVVTVSEVSDEAVVLDANHPLAGEDLTFTVELVEIV
jgi:peptidylprolyl isomerase